MAWVILFPVFFFLTCPETPPGLLHPYLSLLVALLHLPSETEYSPEGHRLHPPKPRRILPGTHLPPGISSLWRHHSHGVLHALLAPGESICGSTLWGVKEDTSQHHASWGAHNKNACLKVDNFRFTDWFIDSFFSFIQEKCLLSTNSMSGTMLRAG